MSDQERLEAEAWDQQLIRPAEPARIARLPRDRRGFPVPWFVAWIDGQPDFRIIGRGKIERAVSEHLCWICGHRLTRHSAFTIGPMCAVNRISAEPPSHVECALFSAHACPFLSNPRMRRNEKNKPDAATNPAGEMIKRNPGVVLVWVTRSWTLIPDARGGRLFQVGNPTETYWLREGRAATRAEAKASIESGLPLLAEHCDTADDYAALEIAVDRAMPLLPQEAA